MDKNKITKENKIVLPGELVCNANMPFMEGVFEYKGTLRSSRFGTLKTKPQLNVKSERIALIPEINQTIIGRITKLSSRYAAVDILAIEISLSASNSSFQSIQTTNDVDMEKSENNDNFDGNSNNNVHCLDEPFRGTIRIQDIFPIEEKEMPIIYEAFRPTDLVRAKIIGIGEPAAGYLLSTGLTEDLGVIFAKSSSTCQPMIPIAWNEMQCLQSGIKEKRKCAKPR